MMLGKRGRGAFRRTTSMTGIAVDVEAAPPPPRGGDRLGVYDQHMMMLSPRYLTKVPDMETTDFLRRCGLCRRHLGPGRDIYMYMGDTAFCSLECREQKMKEDERKERRATTTTNNGDSHHHRELATTATGNSSKSESVAAA